MAADWPPLEGGGSKLPQERLPIRKIKEVLRLQSLGLSQRQIAASCAVGQATVSDYRSEEHTSELQSPCNLVCRLLLEKKNKTNIETVLALWADGCARQSHRAPSC